MTVNMYKDDASVEHVDCSHWLKAIDIARNTECRTLDRVPRDHNDLLFGSYILTSNRVELADIDDDFLKRNWLPETIQHGVVATNAESDTSKSKKKWSVDMVCLPQF